MSTYLDDLAKANWEKAFNLTKQQQKELLKAYEEAFQIHFKKFMDAPESTATKAFRKQYAEHMHQKIEQITKKYAIKMSNDVLYDYNMFNTANQGVKNLNPEGGLAFNKIINSLRNDTVEQILSGNIYKDGRGLSTRIWNAVNAEGQKIQDVVNSCLAANLGSADMSKILKSFVKPGSTTEWDRRKIREKLGPGYASWNKNFNYEALRLARTTISHTATLSMKNIPAVNPFIQKVQWSSAHAIGRTCATCADRDGRKYTLQRVPFDHPNGLCSLIPLVPDLDEIGNKLKDWCDGKEVPEMDKWWAKYHKGQALDEVKKQAKKAVGEASTKQSKPKGGKGASDSWYDKNFSALKKNVSKEEWNDIKLILNNMPENCRKLYAKSNSTLRFKWLQNGDAYYHPLENVIYMDKSNSLKNCESGAYNVLFHEWGHFVDALKGPQNSLSRGMSYSKKLKKDWEDLIVKKAHEIGTKYKSQAIDAIRKELYSLGESSAGVQDIICGITKNSVTMEWGHSADYWDKDDNFLNMEAFANMMASTADPKINEIMKTYFPSGYKHFLDLVDYGVKRK